ncbi:MAG: hypothetical protein WCR54_04625 [Clostridia bacterium]
MENKLIYSIGEVLIMEIEDIENITYPKEYELEALKIETKNGKSWQLAIERL